MDPDNKENLMLIRNIFSYFFTNIRCDINLSLLIEAILIGYYNVKFNGMEKKIFPILIRYSFLTEPLLCYAYVNASEIKY